MRSRLPDMMKTAELSVLMVAVKTAMWTSGPTNPTTDWMLCISAYTEPARPHIDTTTHRLQLNSWPLSSQHT